MNKLFVKCWPAYRVQTALSRSFVASLQCSLQLSLALSKVEVVPIIWRLYRFYEQQKGRVIVAAKAESTYLHTQYLQRYSDANSCIPIISSNLNWPFYNAGM